MPHWWPGHDVPLADRSNHPKLLATRGQMQCELFLPQLLLKILEQQARARICPPKNTGRNNLAIGGQPSHFPLHELPAILGQGW
jgi:hypothetical protein